MILGLRIREFSVYLSMAGENPEKPVEQEKKKKAEPPGRAQRGKREVDGCPLAAQRCRCPGSQGKRV